MTASPSIGPPPAGPLMCFRCVTGTCSHRRKFSDTHGGGMVPALTLLAGTSLCLDCASDAAEPEPAVNSTTGGGGGGGGGSAWGPATGGPGGGRG